MVDEDTQMSLNPKKKEEGKPIRIIDNTMAVLKEEDREVDYIVLKIGDQTFSTNHQNGGKANISGVKAKMQIVDTVGIGKNKNLWCKGVLTEGKNHQKITPIPFELNVYMAHKERGFEER
jgi:hypothetical protein